MAEWHGYVLVGLVPGHSMDSAQRNMARTAIAGTTRPWDNKQPAQAFQARVALSGQHAIYEGVWDYEDPEQVREDVSNAVAAALGLPLAALKLMIEYVEFGDIGSTWDESRQAANAYLSKNAGEWENEAEK